MQGVLCIDFQQNPGAAVGGESEEGAAAAAALLEGTSARDIETLSIENVGVRAQEVLLGRLAEVVRPSLLEMTVAWLPGKDFTPSQWPQDVRVCQASALVLAECNSSAGLEACLLASLHFRSRTRPFYFPPCLPAVDRPPAPPAVSVVDVRPTSA
jgi:hypothetical protein